jgi:hypothetical protein
MVVCFDIVAMGVGAFFVWSAQRTARRRRREALIVGYVRSHPRVKLHDLAGYLGVPRAQAEEDLLALVQREQLDLIVHQPGEEYLDRKLVPELGGSLVSTCARCGAPAPTRVVLPGEDARCGYCGRSMLGS